MFVFTMKGQDLIARLYKDIASNFKKDIQKAWSKADQKTLGEITRTQLSGRKGGSGLNRVSGNAARALNNTVKIEGGNVVSRTFISKNNPAKLYLPIHDKSRAKGSGDFARGVIKAKRAPYMVFKTRDGKWHSVKEVKIPVRTNIIEVLQKTGGKRRARSVNDVLKTYAV